MSIIRNTFVLIIILFLAAGCTTVQERRAFSDWKEENQRFSGSRVEDANLPELAENATLDDYVLYAMLNNPGLHAAFERWKAALEKVTPARTLPDPRFTYANYIKEVETRVGPQEHKFGLAQTFPWFGKLDLRGEMALQDAQAERQRYEAEKLDLIYRVKNIYYEYGYLAQAINIARDNVTLLTHFESVARAKYRGGAGLQSAVIKVQVELGKLEDRLRSRFQWGLLTDIQPPSLETRLAILQDKATALETTLPEDIALLIAQQARHNIRELEGCITKIIALSHFLGKAISADLAAMALADIASPEPATPPDSSKVTALVAAHYQLPPETLRHHRRDRKTLLPQRIAMYILTDILKQPLQEVATFLGHWHIRTVRNAVKDITHQLANDTALQDVVKTILYNINTTEPYASALSWEPPNSLEP